MRKVLIVGSGFRGFCAALRLLKNPSLEVHILDTAPNFGGVMYSRNVHGFYVDNGVQMFDSVPQSLADVVTEIMNGQVSDIDFISESAFNDHVTTGFSLPDLSCLSKEVKDKISGELIELAASTPELQGYGSLQELFDRRYGCTAGQIFSEIFNRIYDIAPNKVEASALSHTSLGRLKHLCDEEMLVLKNNEWLDQVLAARRKSMGKIDDFVSIYPTAGSGMQGFCVKAMEWLTNQGVTVALGSKINKIMQAGKNLKVHTKDEVIDTDLVFWANDNIDQLMPLIGYDRVQSQSRHYTAMVFMTLITQAQEIKDFTYLQNFTTDQASFRIASAGHYSKQYTDDGLSFLTCECPVVPDSSFWDSPEDKVYDVWDECKKLNVVSDNATLMKYDAFRVRTTNRLPLVGYEQQLDSIGCHLKKHFPNIIVEGMDLFNRRQIYLGSEFLENI